VQGLGVAGQVGDLRQERGVVSRAACDLDQASE